MTTVQESADIVQHEALEISDSENQYLTFLMGEEQYAVDILSVQEIRGWDKPTELPHCPTYIKGVINLRGTIVPIMDIRQRFNVGRAEYGPTTVVIILKTESAKSSRIMGIVVDAVSDVFKFASDSLKAAPEFDCHMDIEFITGLANVSDQMIVVLDIDKVLDVERMQEIE